MKEYKLVYLNPKLHLSRQSDLNDATAILNQYAREGWQLQQVVSPSDIVGALVAVLFRDV